MANSDDTTMCWEVEMDKLIPPKYVWRVAVHRSRHGGVVKEVRYFAKEDSAHRYKTWLTQGRGVIISFNKYEAIT